MDTTDRDPQLWQLAKARARFKSHLFLYLLINALLWTIWALTGQESRPVPWPLWATAFWGLVVLMRGVGVYTGCSREQLSEREYAKLLRERQAQR